MLVCQNYGLLEREQSVMKLKKLSNNDLKIV